jgi:hypothetical protein
MRFAYRPHPFIYPTAKLARAHGKITTPTVHVKAVSERARRKGRMNFRELTTLVWPEFGSYHHTHVHSPWHMMSSAGEWIPSGTRQA